MRRHRRLCRRCARLCGTEKTGVQRALREIKISTAEFAEKAEVAGKTLGAKTARSGFSCALCELCGLSGENGFAFLCGLCGLCITNRENLVFSRRFSLLSLRVSWPD